MALQEGAGERAAVEVVRTNPEAIAAREASQTRFEGENPAQAAQTLREAFPGVTAEQDGGPPPLVEGVRSLGFEGATVEQVETGSGEVGVMQSTVPIAVASAAGHWAAVNLSLRETGGGFEAENPLVAVSIPKHLAEGAQITGVGLSLTPVDEHGVPLGGSEGVIDGTGVFFANTQTDSDTVLKPSSFGVEASTILRAVDSPEVFYYRVGIPQGARLVASSSGLGAEVLDEGVVVARIKPPAAADATGTPVPVSTSVSGNVLAVSVKHGEGSYQYPILVDPELSGYWQAWSSVVPGNWEFHEWAGYKYEIAGPELRIKHEPGSFQANDYATWSEKTKGYTKIFDVFMKDELYPGHYTPGWMNAFIELYKSGGSRENKVEVSGSPYNSEPTVCGVSGCGSAEHDAEGNAFLFTLTTNEAGSTGEQFYAHAEVATGIAQESSKHSTVKYNTWSEKVEGATNVLSGAPAWLGLGAGKLEYFSEDLGLGVTETKVEVDEPGGWETVGGTNYVPTSSCVGIQCATEQHEVLSYKTLTDNGAKPLPEPEAHIRVSARSSMPYSSSAEHGEGERVLKVDNKAPHGITVSGLPAKGEGGKELTLGEGPAHLVAEASDGEGTTPSSGVKEIRLYMDGAEIGHGGGSCTPGPCRAAAQWSLSGAEFGAGAHTLTVQAEGNTGQRDDAEYTVNVYAASPVAAGPGSVNPESGDFALEASDVSMSGGMGSLGLSRHYDSRNPKEGEEGPLGVPWNASLGSLASLEVLPEGSVMVVGPTGLSYFKAKTGGGFEAPQGDANLELKYEPTYEGRPAYLFKDSKEDTTTVFTLPAHANHWMPTLAKGPVATDTTTDEYKTVEVSAGKFEVEPTLELAPHPSLTCEPGHWAAGCRALTFVYDESTTAGGEAESEWGGYKNRLKEVIAIAYNPTTKKSAETPVAAYRYDKQGRLRAEWNPSISPALKTVYGYDDENHVTAVTPPGQEPWLLHYGTTAQDITSGRLLSVGRLGPKTALGTVEVLKNTTAPTLSTTSPVIGTTLSMTNGSWSTSAALYSYQWVDCNSSGQACVAIAGAVNQTYTPQPRDAGYTLEALVTAQSAWGAVTSWSAPSQVVAMPTPTYSSAFGNTGSESEKLSSPAGVAVDSEDNVWVADLAGNRVEKFSPSGTFLASYTPDSMLEPAGVAFDPTSGDIYVTNRGHDRIDQLTLSGALIRSFGGEGATYGKLDYPNQVAVDSHGDVWVANTSNSRAEEFSAEGTYLGGINAYLPVGVAECDGALYVTGYRADAVQQWSLGGSLIREIGAAGSGNGDFSNPQQIACEPAGGDIYVADTGNNRVEEFDAAGAFLDTFGTSGSGEGELSSPGGIAVGPAGIVYIGDSANNRVAKWKPSYSTNNPPPTPPAITENPVSTIEYNISLSGSGLPNLTSGEVSKWAQKDDPVEATAIFPPDEPMGWPAANYKRATISYQDEQMRTVNVAGPSGSTPTEAISTTEFNSENEIVRALSAENRATALKEANPATASELLDTKSAYSKGELTETWGPQHTVKLAKGKNEANETTLARNHVKYFYDEGAPEGETYELVTKVVDGAETPAKEEFDQRTTDTSYSGQSNLGWKLRQPTSTTTEPGGLNLTSTVKYEEATGNVVETQTPAAAGKDTKVPPAYAAQFGTKGSGAGQLEVPTYDAIDAHGDIWVTEYKDNRISEFSSSGTFIETVGWGVSNGEAKLQVCASSCKAGIAGTGKGQLEEPTGIAIAGGDIYIVDTGNNRIEVLNEKGEYVTQWGSVGTAAGKFKTPLAIAVNSSNDVWVGDSLNRRLQEFTAAGTFIEAVGWGVSNGKEEYEVCKSSCQAGTKGSGNGQFTSTWGLAFARTAGGGVDLYVTDTGNNRVEAINEKSEYAGQFGTKGRGNGQLEAPVGIATSATTGALYVTDTGNNRVQVFTPAGEYLTQFGTEGSGNGQVDFPEGSAINPAGEMYVVDDLNHRVERWVPTITGNEGAHDTKTTYYTAKEEAAVPACRNHPEWINLPCQTEPVAQPSEGVPQLPVTNTTYNMWEQPETIAEKFGTVERKRKTTFEESGRPVKTEESSSNDQPLPTVTNGYNEHTGALQTQSTTVGEKTETITSIVNDLGQLERYTDADGNTAEYKRDIDGRVTELTDGTEEAIKKDGYEGKQKYHYDETTGQLIKLEDSAAGTFTASYTIGGRLKQEGYPNGMTAYYTSNPAGQQTGIEYKKEAHCAEKCVWLSDQITPSIHGETITQVSSLSAETYSYGGAGWLNQVQETPAGEGCKTRVYNYDEEGDRTTLTTREPAAENKCANEGGTTEWHTYDTANRLSDPGVTYEAFGNTTALPASEAGGSSLTSSFYVDNQVYKQTQDGTTIEYVTDPEDRTRETVTGSGAEAAKSISHYDGPGSTLAWTLEVSTGKWTRNIPGIGGELAATQTNSTAPVLLLHDLQGNVVAEAGISETETKLLKTYDPTEYGVPTKAEAPPKYAWLGAAGLASELPSGTITQDGATYVPETGRPLQTQPIELPLPMKYLSPYERPNAEGATYDAISAALSIGEAKQAERAQELAENPAGTVPVAGCNEEVIWCVEDPQHGTNIDECKVGAKLEISFREITYEAAYKCGHPNRFEVELLVQELQPNGEWANISGTTKKTVFSTALDGEGHHYGPFTYRCEVGQSYRSWAYGRDWHAPGNDTIWTSSVVAYETHKKVCENTPGEGPDLPPGGVEEG